MRRSARVFALAAAALICVLAAPAAASAAPDLKATISVSPDPVPAGGSATLRITVANIGDAAATNVQMGSSTPSSTTFQSLSGPSDWATTHPLPGASGSVNATKPALAAGASATFVLVVKVDPGTTN